MALSRAARWKQLYPFKPASTSVDHIVIGGGVVGLAVAAGLVNTAGVGRTTFLVERRGLLGQENTARNSEVIHSGIYYPIGSLKSKLCIRGRDMIYERCQQLGIDHRKTEKLIVATENNQVPYLDKLQDQTAHPSLSTGKPDSHYSSNSMIPTYFLSKNEALGLEPDLHPGIVGALLVTDTGIVDSQGLVDSLAREVEEEDYAGSVGVGLAESKPARGEGVVVMGTRVVRIDREEKGNGWVVQLETGWEGKAEGEKGEVESVRADVVVNAAGLGAASLLEGLVPENEQPKMWPLKGNYMSYKGPGVGNISRLIYPCPSQDLDHLGTHLTMDLHGNVKFGPDAEPLGDPETSARDPDFWQKHLVPSAEHIASIGAAVQTYLPGIDPSLLEPDYVGIRPNIAAHGSGFFDFMIRHSPDRKGLVELLGFASPGLTSSLAVGEHVSKLVRKDVWGDKASIEQLAEGWER